MEIDWLLYNVHIINQYISRFINTTYKHIIHYKLFTIFIKDPQKHVPNIYVFNHRVNDTGFYLFIAQTVLLAHIYIMYLS